MEEDNLVLEEWFKAQGFTEDVGCVPAADV